MSRLIVRQSPWTAFRAPRTADAASVRTVRSQSMSAVNGGLTGVTVGIGGTMV